METIIKTIGISGIARSGKDSFFTLLSKKIPNIKRFGLADNLKNDLNPFFIKNYNIDIFNCTPEQKELVRPILVAHGKIRRIESKGRCWTEKLQAEIENYHKTNPEGIAVVTDIRYDEYDRDELFWLKEEMKGILVHIQRYHDVFLGGRTFVKPPNEDEKKNDPKIQAKADFKIEWPTVQNLDELNPFIDDFIKFLNDK